jgi:homoserine kinase
MPSTNPKPPRTPDPVDLLLPATSANLGPAFDAAALAVGLFLKIRARPAAEFSVLARGRDVDVCGRLEKHLILTTYCEVLAAEGRRPPPLALEIDNQIPIGKGCGSSASARLAGIALAVHFGRLQWSDDRIVGEAACREHHPDNASACWMGGVTVARMVSENQAQVARVTPRGEWPLLLAVPEARLSTEEARRVLPSQYSRGDVVINIQNSMLLLAALTQGRADLLAGALHDRIHQPYRASLCPLLPALQGIGGKSGLLGAVLSGAGPSVVLFLDPQASAKRAKTAVADHLCRQNLAAELIATSITSDGGAQGQGWRKRRR